MIVRRTLPFLLLVLAACGKKDEAPPTPATTNTVTPPPVATPVATPAPAASAEPAIEVNADMQGFLAMLDGSEGSAGKALKKYGTPAVQKNDVGVYSFKSPKVTKAEKLGVMQCYTFEAAAGATTHQTRTCWDSAGKIAQVTDKTL